MPIAAGQQNTVYTENMHLPGLGVFPREPPKQNPTGPIRQAQSLTDLQTLQQNYNPQMISQPQPFGYTHTTSQQIPATMTPRTLSRQVSISADSGPYQKRRKASGSKKISNDLVMTKLATSEPPTIPASNSLPADQLYSSQSTATSPSPIAFFPSNFSSGQTQSGPTSTMPTQYDTNPSTPIHNDSTFSAAVPKSQSMENLDVDLQWSGSPSSNALSEPYNSTSGLPQLHTHGPGNLFGVTFPRNTLHRALSSHHVPVGTPLENEAPADYPIITKTIPREGPMSGGIEVTCIGTGFYEGLSVLFGNAIATTISVLGDTCLVCFLPPATRDGVVSVRCNHDYRGVTLLQPLRQVYFTYVDDDDLQLLKLALVTLNHRLTGRTEDAGDIARKTMNNSHSGIASHTGMAGQAREQYRQACQPNSALMTMEDLESSLLGCLDIIDLDDSPNQPRLNRRRPNGQSMLHFSASLGFYRFVAALLARGANPDLRDKNGMSPMHMAALHNHSRIVRKLRSAGGDPMLRSLRGFTPADMASTTEVRDVINILEHFSVSGITGESPISRRSRTSSVTSFQPPWGGFSNSGSMNSEAELPYDIVAVNSEQADATESSHSHVASPAQAWARSRRNSDAIEKPYVNSHSPRHQARNDGLLAAATAWSAWRDQLVSQVQILQQSVHRTLPTLPMPTLPPIPNLPYYQAYPMVRRISSLVPQRYPRTFARDSKYNDYHWWELIKGTTAPPAYEELYPNQGQGETATTKGSIKTTEGEAELIAEGSTASDRAALNASLVLNRAEISTKVLTPQQREDLMAAHAMKVKRLRSDRNLFFFWVRISSDQVSYDDSF